MLLLPCNGNLLVRELPKDTERFGLVIPETTQDQDRVVQAQVIKVDKSFDIENAAGSIEPDDVVLHKAFLVKQRFNFLDTDYYFVHVDEVLGIVRADSDVTEQDNPDTLEE